MLLILSSAFLLSQAFRTLAAIMAAPLAQDFGLSAQALGVFAGAFHFAFGALQLFMGIGIDLQGVRRTVLAAFPLAIVGAAMSALAPSFHWLLLGQVLIGIGCAPAFLVCTVFIARHFAPERFAAVSGAILGFGSVGMLLTGTPLAWLIEASSWRMGFWVLCALSVIAWCAIAMCVREPHVAAPAGARRETLGQAVRTFGGLLLLPHTLGIVALALVTYAAFVALRGLWLGPMLMQRHGFSLVASGNVALLMTLIAMFSPPLFGRLDPGPARRRRWIVGFTLLVAALFCAMGFAVNAMLDVALIIAVGFLSGYMVLQYPDVKGAYPAAVTGRAMALFTMAMFLGVALMQWLTGAIATYAQHLGVDPFMAVFLSIGALLAAGAAGFVWLPKPPVVPAGAAAQPAR
ncbi:MFS transporter [Xenophilus arseniciresistens]|uniref:MFS transporter n=1 Tax=Xenophilus arseniciresistens TaxID=1283306 RepID=A0AAE3NDZ1_9BURK|nr:MFS transporter [Xenophilus arseniciresistens]MDA7418512.1 MFS transporter [Xenophilus arseniciresistens]